ncbi:MAG: amidohydrolase family protein [Lentisphaerae bacterium]|nr:amidohydrolase family protein [Lentisphaerota bacterium]
MPFHGTNVESRSHRRVFVRRWACLVWLAAGMLIPAAYAQTPAPAQWIDVHLHLIGGRGQDYAGAADTAIREMDRFGIATAIVLPPPQIDRQPVYDASSFTGALRRHRGRFAWLGGGGTLNSTIHRYADPAKITDAVKRDFAAAADKIIDDGAAGFGEMASLHISAAEGHPYEFVPADHPLFLVLADVAARRDVPIDLHMDAVDGGMPTPTRFAKSSNPPQLADTMRGLARLLAYNPKAKIVWAHGGSDPLGAMTPAAIGRLMEAHSNLYVSLRIVGAQAPMTNKALSGGGLDPDWKELLSRHPDRFMIGTDSFMVSASVRGGGPGVTFAQKNTPTLQATVHFLSLLPPDVAARLVRENAMRIYKLPPK